MLKHTTTENKLNSLILEYGIVLGLCTYFRKVALNVNCKRLLKVASSLYSTTATTLISALSGFTECL